MGMICCPECKKKISSFANICPSCGFPIEKFLNDNNITDVDNTVLVCPKCAETYCCGFSFEIRLKCEYCNSIVVQTNENPKELFGLSVAKSTEEEFKRRSIEICKKYGNNQFSQDAYDERYGIIKRNHMRLTNETKQDAQKQPNLPKCPMCGSTNIQKISTLNRATSIIGLGILSKKIGKQWQCNNPKCKHLW